MTNTAATTTGIKRALAGLLAAASIAIGGTTVLSAQEAQAAGVQTTAYANLSAATGVGRQA